MGFDISSLDLQSTLNAINLLSSMLNDDAIKNDTVLEKAVREKLAKYLEEL